MGKECMVELERDGRTGEGETSADGTFADFPPTIVERLSASTPRSRNLSMGNKVAAVSPKM